MTVIVKVTGLPHAMDFDNGCQIPPKQWTLTMIVKVHCLGGSLTTIVKVHCLGGILTMIVKVTGLWWWVFDNDSQNHWALVVGV